MGAVSGGGLVVDGFAGAVAKGVRWSEDEIRGKEAVEKRYRSRGAEVGEWIIKEVEAIVHCGDCQLCFEVGGTKGTGMDGMTREPL